MEINDIRQCFSKGEIKVDDGVSVYYTFKNGFFVESIEGISKSILSELLKKSEHFEIKYNNGNFILLLFDCDASSVDFGNCKTIFMPLKKQISEREIQNIVDNAISKSDVDREVEEFFSGVDMLDEDAMLNRLGDFLDYKRGNPQIDLCKVREWKDIKDIAIKLSREFCFECTYSPPETDGCGFVELNVGNGKRKEINIEGNSLQEFQNIIDLSGVIDIEGNVMEGILNITFYVNS